MGHKLHIYAVEDLRKSFYAPSETLFFEDEAALETAARAHVIKTGEAFTVDTDADPALCSDVVQYARICNIAARLTSELGRSDQFKGMMCEDPAHWESRGITDPNGLHAHYEALLASWSES